MRNVQVLCEFLGVRLLNSWWFQRIFAPQTWGGRCRAYFLRWVDLAMVQGGNLSCEHQTLVMNAVFFGESNVSQGFSTLLMLVYLRIIRGCHLVFVPGALHRARRFWTGALPRGLFDENIINHHDNDKHNNNSIQFISARSATRAIVTAKATAHSHPQPIWVLILGVCP